MKDQSKTKQVLIQELDSLREKIAELERTESEHKQAEETLQLQEMQLRAILESAGDGILAVDNAGRVIRTNRRFADLWKIPSGLLEKSSDEALLKDVLDQLVDPEAFLEKVHALYESTTEDFDTILFKDGRIIERYSCPLLNEGVINGRVWSFRDITDRVRAEEALKENEEKYRNLFQNANEAIFVAQDGKLVFLNPMSVKLIGYSGEEVMSRSFIEFIHPDDRDMVIDRHIRRMKGEEIPSLYSFRIIHRDGNVKWVELNAVSISWEGKTATLNFMNDITDRKQTEEAIRQMAYHDTLTGLPNRKLFFDRLGIALAQDRRNQRGVAIAMLDLDNFKDVNDHLGHDVGDLVLREAAERLSDTMRRGDTVARFGGDEFILILPELKGADAVQVAEKLVDAFRKPFLIDDHELIITTSVGIAIYPGDGMDVDALIKNADIAMYQAKQTGRDRYHLYKKSPEAGDAVNALKDSKGCHHESTGNDFTKDQSKIKQVLIQELASLKQRIADLERTESERKRVEETLRESEEKYRLIAENTADLISILDMNLRLTYVSPASMRLRGFTVEEAMEQTLEQVLTPESMRLSLTVFEEEMQLESSGTADPDRMRILELEEYKKDGSIIWVEISLSFLRDKDRKPVEILIVSRDITERKRAEEALRERDIQFMKLSSWVPGMIYQFTKRPDGTYCVPFTTEAIKDIFGCSPQDVREDFSPIARIILPEDFDKVVGSIEYSAKHLTIWTCEYRVQIPGQSIRWISGNSTPEKLADGSITWYGFNTDITDRKQAEEALRESEEKYRAIIENMEDGYHEVDIKGNFTFFNESMRKIMGYEREELLGMNNRQFSDEENARKVYQTYNRVYRTGEPAKNFEWQIIRKDNDRRDIEVSISLIRDTEGHPTGFRGIARDTTERKRAEEELRESEEKYRNILENIEDGYFEVDLAGNFTFFNPSLCRILGYPREEMPGMNNRIFMDAENAKKIFRAFNEVYVTGIPQKGFDWETIRKDGARTYIEVSVSLIARPGEKPTGFRGIARDITDRKQAEEQLQHTLDSLRKAFGTTIHVLVSAVETRDPYTAGHQVRSADLARAIATEMGFTKERIDGIRMAGSIHDIGKLSIPAEILSKPTKLTKIEFSLIKEHSQKGYEMLKDVESPWPLAQIVYQHHERMNGSGYPRNLKGDDILMEARILAVADVVESMASHRPYRPAMGIDAALEEIEKSKGILYDNTVVDACLRLFREKGFQLE